MKAMKPTVRSTLLLSLLATWAVAVAQTPPDGEPAAVVAAEEQAPEEEPDESSTDTGVDTGVDEEEEPAAEASAEDVFKPGDEISEDYPVPLPSDI